MESKFQVGRGLTFERCELNRLVTCGMLPALEGRPRDFFVDSHTENYELLKLQVLRRHFLLSVSRTTLVPALPRFCHHIENFKMVTR